MDNNKNLPKIVEQEEEFPPPPDKPQKPVNFSRRMAIENPHSKSALYLDELDNWRDLMIMYNQMLAQYDVEMLRENMTNFFEILLESDSPPPWFNISHSKSLPPSFAIVNTWVDESPSTSCSYSSLGETEINAVV